MTEETKQVRMYEVHVHATRRGESTVETARTFYSPFKDSAERWRDDMVSQADRAFTRGVKTLLVTIEPEGDYLGSKWVINVADYTSFRVFLKKVIVTVQIPDKKPLWTGSQ